MNGEAALLASTNFQPLSALVLPTNAFASVNFLKYKRGFVPAVVFTPEKSVMLAEMGGKVEQYDELVMGVNEMAGALASKAVPANSTAPQSGNAGRVAPLISVSTWGKTAALPSAKVEPVGADNPDGSTDKLFSAKVPKPRVPATALNIPHDVLKFGSLVRLYATLGTVVIPFSA